MSMNFMVYAVGMLGYWICGYALQMGGVGGIAALGGVAPLNHEFAITLAGKTFGLFGLKGFFLSGDSYDVGVFTLFLFQMVFMDTAATIPTGAMAERWKFSAFLVFGFFMSMFIYPIFANWVWGGGWLPRSAANFGLGHGHVDFAGSSVVHMVGGVAGLAGAIVIGPRIGKFTKRGDPVADPGHHIPMAIVGTFILAFGWFGFNPGSTLSGGDLRIAIVATNTMLASAAGAVRRHGLRLDAVREARPQHDGQRPAGGPGGHHRPLRVRQQRVGGHHRRHRRHPGRLLGALRGADAEAGRSGRRRVGARGCGAWGVLSLGLFADGVYGDGWNGVDGPVRGLFYGDAGQFVAELRRASSPASCSSSSSFYVFFKVVEAVIGNRVSAEVELEGLDMAEMGAMGYPDFVLTPGPEMK